MVPEKGAVDVEEGTQISSLAAVRIARVNLEFFENDYKGDKSLRAYMTDNDAKYSLPAVAKNSARIVSLDGSDSGKQVATS